MNTNVNFNQANNAALFQGQARGMRTQQIAAGVLNGSLNADDLATRNAGAGFGRPEPTGGASPNSEVAQAQWEEAETVAPCTIARLREQREKLRVEGEELGASNPELESVATGIERANEQLWLCLDGLEEWLVQPTAEALALLEQELRRAEEGLEQASAAAEEAGENVHLELLLW